MSARKVAPSAEQRPLVVDVDGALVRTDLLVESALTAVRENALIALRFPAWLWRGRSHLKRQVARRIAIEPASLPYNQPLLEHLQRERAAGRPRYLATAADRRHVQALTDPHGIFDGAFASDGQVNLAGEHKARKLVDAFGEGGYDYIGHDAIDLPVWRHAHTACLVNTPARVERAARARSGPCEVIEPRRPGRAAWLRAMRPHQWLKNLLVFLPVFAAHDLSVGGLGASALAFVSFSLMASGVYLLNDLFDLHSDRAHPRKSARPLASDALPLLHGLYLAPALALASVLLAATVGWQLLGILLLYGLITTAYSLHLKQLMLVDVATLAGLYTLRVLAGAAAAGVAVSAWLIAFSMFLFLALAIVKRYAELTDFVKADAGVPAGRGYEIGDLSMLAGLGAAAGYSAVLVLALYIESDQVQSLYEHPMFLWGVCALLLYWLSRMLMISHRGGMRDDPLVYALTDRVSLAIVALAALLVLAAS